MGWKTLTESRNLVQFGRWSILFPLLPVSGDESAELAVKGHQAGRLCVNWGGTAGCTRPRMWEEFLFACDEKRRSDELTSHFSYSSV